MNENYKINLEKLINNSDDYVDNTSKIRELKHSDFIKLDVNKLIKLKKANSGISQDDCISECNFLFTYYPNIFLKVFKNEIEIKLLDKFILCLKEIEDGLVDQNEASVKVGTILKEIYIDSALKKSEKIDNKISTKPAKKLSWKEYKLINKNN